MQKPPVLTKMLPGLNLDPNHHAFGRARINPGLDGNKIKTYRLRMGLTQIEAMNQAGIKGWGALELQKGRIPTLRVLEALEKVLGVPAHEMLADGRPPLPDTR